MDDNVNTGGIFSDRLEALIAAALQDGVLTDKERELLKRRAEKEGEDWDEVEMIIEARLSEMQTEKGTATMASPVTPTSIATPLPAEDSKMKAEQEELPIEPKSFKRDFGNDKASLVIPEGVTVIEELAYGFCNKLQSVTLPSTLVTIERKAFCSCSELTNVDFSRCMHLEKIAEGAFSCCSGLANVDLSRCMHLEKIAEEAFYFCGEVKELFLPDSVEQIGKNALMDCERIVFPASLRTIVEYSFYSKNFLQEADLSRCTQLKEIKEAAFRKCTNLKKVVFPASLVEIGSSAFKSCEKLEMIDFTACSQLRSIGEEAFIWSAVTNVAFPASVEEVEKMAFFGCKKLKKVDFSACTALTSIGDEAFAYCEKLSNIILPDSITHIGEDVFCSCNNLDSIDMSKVTKLKTIPKGFRGTATTIIPQGVTEVEDQALKDGEKLFLPPTLQTYGKKNGRWKAIYLFAPIFDQLDALLTFSNCLYVLPQYLSAYEDLWDALGNPNRRAEILPMPDEYQYYYDN